jgi:ParB-like chromosome segregation protein Spo0J
MAQAVFSTEAIKRSVSLYAASTKDIILPPLALSGRKDYAEADIASLAADIHKRGQDTPVMVRKNDAGLPVLVYGRRRFLAVKYLNEKLRGPQDKEVQLQCKYESSMSDEEALIAAISENRFRKDVNDMDHCHNIAGLMKRYKFTVEDVADIYFPEAADGKAKTDAARWVRERASLAELAPEAAQAVRDGEIKITSAKQLAKMPKDEQRKVIAAKSTVAGKSRVKVADVKKAKPAPAPAKKQPASAPTPIVPVAKSSTVLEAAETMARALDAWITDATDKAEKAVLTAHKQYRALVPFAEAVGKAA